jgi:hypothetical protein
VAAVDAQAVLLAAVGAGQAVGVQLRGELGVAAAFVEVVDQGEILGEDLRQGRTGIAGDRLPGGAIAMPQSTEFAS